MKKFLFLLALVAFVATSASAQQLKQRTKMNTVKPSFYQKHVYAPAKNMKNSFNSFKKAPKKSPLWNEVDSLALYTRPEGSFFVNDWLYTQLAVPAWTPITFNLYKSQKVETTWTIGGFDPLEGDVDEKGNVIQETFPTGDYFSTAYLPTLNWIVEDTQLPDSFNLGEGNFFFNKTYWPNYNVCSLNATDTICTLGIYSLAEFIGYSDEAHTRPYPNRYLWWGDKDPQTGKHNMIFGTQANKVGTATANNVNFYQFYEKPISPLWIERIQFLGVSQSGALFTGDAKLTLNIRKVNYVQETDEETGETHEVKELGDIIETMTCGKADVLDAEVSGGEEYGYINFKKTKTNAFGEPEPVYPVLTEEFAIEVTGFNETGVDVGVASSYITEVDKLFAGNQAYFDMVEADGTLHEKYGYVWLAPSIEIMGVYDGINVETVIEGAQETYTDFNILTVPTEGTDFTALNKYDSTADIYTTMPWYNPTTGEENYSFIVTNVTIANDGTQNKETVDALPEWLVVEVDDSERNLFEYNGHQYYGRGMETVVLTGNELPADVKGRVAIVTIVGKGVTANNPIIIKQGDVPEDIYTGIDNVKSNNNTVKTNATYNLAGQKVCKDYKGIVVRDGKKFMVK